MKTRYVLALATAALICSGSPAALADGAVIANSSLSLSSADVKDIFTGEKQLAGSTKLTPVDNAAAQTGGVGYISGAAPTGVAVVEKY